MRRYTLTTLVLILVTASLQAQGSGILIGGNSIKSNSIESRHITTNSTKLEALRTALGLAIGTDVLSPTGSGTSLTGIVDLANAQTITGVKTFSNGFRLSDNELVTTRAGLIGPQGPAGAQGPEGPAGADGAQGPAGPNAISTSTKTTGFTAGQLVGSDGANVKVAVAGTDYLTPTGSGSGLTGIPAPSNMVTTDTNQTVSGSKTLTGQTTFGTMTYPTVALAFNSSATTIEVNADGRYLPPYGVVLVDDEEVKYSSMAWSPASQRWILSTLTRGYNGTTAASHSLNTTISIPNIYYNARFGNGPLVGGLNGYGIISDGLIYSSKGISTNGSLTSSSGLNINALEGSPTLNIQNDIKAPYTNAPTINLKAHGGSGTALPGSMTIGKLSFQGFNGTSYAEGAYISSHAVTSFANNGGTTRLEFGVMGGQPGPSTYLWLSPGLAQFGGDVNSTTFSIPTDGGNLQLSGSGESLFLSSPYNNPSLKVSNGNYYGSLTATGLNITDVNGTLSHSFVVENDESFRSSLPLKVKTDSLPASTEGEAYGGQAGGGIHTYDFYIQSVDARGPGGVLGPLNVTDSDMSNEQDVYLGWSNTTGAVSFDIYYTVDSNPQIYLIETGLANNGWNSWMSGTSLGTPVSSIPDVTPGSESTMAGNGVITPKVVVTSLQGLYIQSPNAHYWKISVDNSGTISTTDVGTSVP